ncbi:unnamed protein product [Pleuronectes platessa]|uniref:Uncharacterized protein n=1 Tax=Pleuronectes platessa TaxID=8262 RepID=A0A9N7Y069_PLEPL|nr:unnamed protein product [Pleuronectes platessa]
MSRPLTLILVDTQQRELLDKHSDMWREGGPSLQAAPLTGACTEPRAFCIVRNTSPPIPARHVIETVSGSDTPRSCSPSRRIAPSRHWQPTADDNAGLQREANMAAS